MSDLTKLTDDQQKVRESLAKQLELLSNASEVAFCRRELKSLARLSEAMGMVANSYLVNYGLPMSGVGSIAHDVAEHMGEQIAIGGGSDG